MPKFRKKPVEVEALQFDGKNHGELLFWAGGFVVGPTERLLYEQDDALMICTLEGKMRADPGDWIIRGVKGEFYPCKPDVFAMTYELSA